MVSVRGLRLVALCYSFLMIRRPPRSSRFPYWTLFRSAPITPDRPAEPPPGMWVPTGTGEMVSPWLGFTEPLVVDSPEEFATDGPDPLDSEAYAADFAEVAAMGSATSTVRTAEQTDLALFWSDNPTRQYQDARSEERRVGKEC